MSALNHWQFDHKQLCMISVCRPLALLSCMALCGVPYAPAKVMHGSQVEAPHAGWCIPPCLMSGVALPPVTPSPTATSPVHQRMEQLLDSCPYWMILDVSVYTWIE